MIHQTQKLMSSLEKVVELVKLINNLITLKDTQDRKDSWYGGLLNYTTKKWSCSTISWIQLPKQEEFSPDAESMVE